MIVLTAEDGNGSRDAAAGECGTSLAELLAGALPPRDNGDLPHTNGGDSECASTSSGGSGGRAPDRPAWPPRHNAFDATVLQEVVGNALDDMHLEDPLDLMAALDRELDGAEPPPVQPPSAPVNIPRFSPPRVHAAASAGSPLPPFLRYSHTDPPFASHSHPAKASFGFDFAPASPGNAPPAELSRLREEVVASRAAVARWDERISQARSACEAWRRELDDAHRKTALAERQRDEALAHALALRRELDAAGAVTAAGSGARSELRGLTISSLKTLQTTARAELEEIEKALYLETATKCMVCEERIRSVTLVPCNHYVMCESCADAASDCPYCQTPIQSMH